MIATKNEIQHLTKAVKRYEFILFYFLSNGFDSVKLLATLLNYLLQRTIACIFDYILLSKGKRGKSEYYKINYTNFLQYCYALIQTVLIRVRKGQNYS